MGLSPEGIKPRFLSKPLEFDGVKIWIIQAFPYTKEFYCVAISNPISYNAVRVFAILLFCYVGYADVINSIFIDGFYSLAFYNNFCHIFNRLGSCFYCVL